jgi:nucleoside-diphosphate-sugar epimerase
MARQQTILVTGATGFIAKHIVQQLLDAGYHVRGSVRSLARGQEVVDAVAPHLRETGDLDKRLSFVELDLTSDDGWDGALTGVDALVHTASPFPMSQPKDEDVLIRPAVDGTGRALKAALAAGVHRVVMTSSAVAVVGKVLEPGRSRFDETDWTDIKAPDTDAYARSKTLAERAAWAFVKQNPDMKLTTINPGFVLGPSLDAQIGTSLALVQRLLNGGDPAIPNFGFATVDVRDVARMHLRALERKDSIGRRFLGCERFFWMLDLAKVLHAEYPDRKIVIRPAPNWLVHMLAWFDPAIKSIVPLLGVELQVDSSAARDVLEIEFIDARQSVRASAASLIKYDLVK